MVDDKISAHMSILLCSIEQSSPKKSELITQDNRSIESRTHIAGKVLLRVEGCASHVMFICCGHENIVI